MTFDVVDDSILVELNKPETPSLADLAVRVNRSKTAIHARLLKLEYWGLISQPQKGQHRARILTPAGKEYLRKNGLAS